jgi:hypothetical protein
VFLRATPWFFLKDGNCLSVFLVFAAYSRQNFEFFREMRRNRTAQGIEAVSFFAAGKKDTSG